MRLILRYGAAALLMAAAAIAAISPFASTLIEQWSRQDIELRSALVFNSVRDELAACSPIGRGSRSLRLFDRLAADDRLIAVGFCDNQGRLLYEGRAFPADADLRAIRPNRHDDVLVLRHRLGATWSSARSRSGRARPADIWSCCTISPSPSSAVRSRASGS